MEDERDPQERREAFQREQLRERLRHADEARQESNRRQDEREERRRQDQRNRDVARMAERDASREHSRDMYDLKRSDKLSDDHAKLVLGAEEQKEITHRETLLRELGARLYRKQLDDDYEHDARTRDLDHQEYVLRSDVDTARITTIDNNTARNTRREIREHLKSALYEKLADHLLAEHAKRSATDQELERMEAESRHRTTEIREEGAAREREIWAENEAKKNFELFMVNLRRQSSDWQTDEIADVLRKMEGLD